MPTEADTCRTYVIPKLKSAGWEDDYITEQRRIVVYLDGLRQAMVNALPAMRFSGRLQSTSGEELSPPLRFGDASQSALMPSILDRALKGEL
ncbi:MAG TPA: hypothetical protein VFR47_00580 [Anaerolineales bacterium]|nr:hypothetical protein [Anaerolineales bacterium]